MRKQGMGATAWLPLMAGVLAAAGCASAYPELDKEIGQAVAAAQPTAADSAAAGARVAANANAGGGATAASPSTPGTAPATAQPTGGAPSMPTGSTMPATSTPAYSPAPSMGTGAAMRVTSVANLPAPEAAVVDTAAGLVLVAGSEQTATGSRGVIMRLDPNGTVRDARWIVGGAKTAILRAPRGMAIVADTLWVVDGTVLRAFSRRTGAPIASIPMGASLGAVSFTDVAVGPNGTLYLADPAVTYTARGVAQRKGSGRIFQVEGRKASVALEHARLVQPKALSWDPITARLMIAAAASDTIMAWRPGQSAPETVAVAPGPWDGVMAIGGMVFYAVNASRGEVVLFQNGMSRRVVEGARGAGDVALDAARSRLVVPFPAESRVDIWEVRR